MSRPSELQLTNVTVGDLQSNPRGGKSAPILSDGKQIRLKLRGCTTPFACSSFDKTSTRRALDLRTDKDLRDFCTRLDAADVVPALLALVDGDAEQLQVAANEQRAETELQQGGGDGSVGFPEFCVLFSRVLGLSEKPEG